MTQRYRDKPPVMVFISLSVVIFFLALSAADSVGFVPNYIDSADTVQAHVSVGEDLTVSNLPEVRSVQSPVVKVGSVTPTRISIPSIDLDLNIQNPATRDIGALDELLKNGPARYVDSAKLGGAGNMIVFAHSSHLPVVRNPMYKAFNRIPELSAGDTITLSGADGKNYIYTVVQVKKANANEDTIPLSTDKTRLTLVTCDTLTSKSSRYILTADFAGIVGS